MERMDVAALRRRRRARLAERGMTLVEIMVVVIIMALIATGVSVAVIPQITKARIKETMSDIGAIRTAVQLHQLENPSECPNMEQLQLDRSKRTVDAWDNQFVIQCNEGADPLVMSKGPDGEEGTEDDIK